MSAASHLNTKVARVLDQFSRPVPAISGRSQIGGAESLCRLRSRFPADANLAGAVQPALQAAGLYAASGRNCSELLRSIRERGPAIPQPRGGKAGVADPVRAVVQSWLWAPILPIARKWYCGPKPISDAAPTPPQASSGAFAYCETLARSTERLAAKAARFGMCIADRSAAIAAFS
jgi:hypothetical protein